MCLFYPDETICACASLSDLCGPKWIWKLLLKFLILYFLFSLTHSHFPISLSLSLSFCLVQFVNQKSVFSRKSFFRRVVGVVKTVSASSNAMRCKVEVGRVVHLLKGSSGVHSIKHFSDLMYLEMHRPVWQNLAILKDLMAILFTIS